MSAITICVDDSIERVFRSEVKHYIGKEKGALGRAVTEAMQLWIAQRKQKTIAKNLKEIFDKGFDMGKVTYTKRGDIYDR